MAITRTYACGSGGRVIRLDNHTGPWIDITPSFPNENETTWFDVMTDPLDPDKVTIVGDDNLSNSVGSGILVSTDAGVSWTNPLGNWQTVPGISQHIFKEVWYADSNTIWAISIGGIVVLSIDGGITFTRTTLVDKDLAAQGACIHAIDQFTAVVAGAPWPAGITSAACYVWKTSDGGLTWQRINSTNSLNNGSQPTGEPEGIWISDDEQRIVVSTTYGQFLSNNGGVSFNPANVPFTRSGRHLTWFPSHDANPATMRHVGGPNEHVNLSTNNGANWTTVRQAQGIIMDGAHFWDTDDGYYALTDGNVYSTNDGAVTGAVSYTTLDGNPLLAVWTQLDPGVEPCPCYLATDCQDDMNTLLITIDCTVDTPYNPLLPGTTYQFTVPGAQDVPGCWTIEEADCALEVPQEVAVTDAWQDCVECLNPLVPNQCWDLEVVCDGPCDDIFAINGFDFTPFIGQNITIQPPLTDPECWYTPYALRQAIFVAAPQSAGGGYNLSWPFGAFQQGTDDITISIPSLIHNNVEQITGTPPSYLMTPANIQFVLCQQMTCNNVPLNNPGGINGYANTVDFINATLASLGIFTMQAYNNSFDNCPIVQIKPRETFRLQYRDGDTFSFTIQYSNIGQGVNTLLYQVQAGNITVSTVNGNIDNPLPTCNDNIYCLTDPADTPIIDGVTVMGDCPVEPIDLGEACELTPRLGEPGFSTKNCDPKKVIQIKTDFANSVYALFKQMRYGIETCCEYDLDKIDIKNQLIDLGELYDPELCVDGTPVDEECCLQPCNAVATLIIPQALSCPAPVDVITDLTIPDPLPIPCLPPVDPITTFTYINPTFCVQMTWIGAPIPGAAGGGSVEGLECDGTPFYFDLPLDASSGIICVQPGSVITTGSLNTIIGSACT